MKRFNVIFAMDSHCGIGRNGGIPWGRIPTDLSFFRRVTTNTPPEIYPTLPNVVIMGRKTWESLPENHRPLSDRVNVVVTRNTSYETGDDTVQVFHSIDEAIWSCLDNQNYGEIFVIGGAEIYNHALTDLRLGNVFITKIFGEYDCDTFIDQTLIDPLRFQTATSLNKITDPSTGITVEFCRMETYQHADYTFGKLLRRILTFGEHIEGRNGGTKRICGDVQLAFSLADGIPVLTGKKILWKPIVEELLFFIRGDTDTKLLEARGAKFWRWNTNRNFLDSRGLTEYPEGEMGPMYGYQWRHFNGDYSPGNPPCGGHDQLTELIEELTLNSSSRRLLLTTFNPTAVNESVLWPCHGIVVQFFVDNQMGLSCKMYQRSADTFLGLPFNIASYALFTCILARICGYTPRSLFITIGDCHLYDNHTEAAEEYLKRLPYSSPRLAIANHIQSLEDVEASTAEDYRLVDYHHHRFIRAEMSA